MTEYMVYICRVLPNLAEKFRDLIVSLKRIKNCPRTCGWISLISSYIHGRISFTLTEVTVENGDASAWRIYFGNF